MTTTTISHYNVFAPTLGSIRLAEFDDLQDALDYRDIVVGLTGEVWVVFTDASSEQVA